LEHRYASLRDHHRTLGHTTAASGVEFLAEQDLPRPQGVRRINYDDVETTVRFGDVFHTIGDDEIEALVGEYRLREFREVAFGKLDNRRVDLHLGKPLDRFVLEHLLGDAAISPADNQHLLGVTMR
jgi:hypothetical protein